MPTCRRTRATVGPVLIDQSAAGGDSSLLSLSFSFSFFPSFLLFFSLPLCFFEYCGRGWHGWPLGCRPTPTKHCPDTDRGLPQPPLTQWASEIAIGSEPRRSHLVQLSFSQLRVFKGDPLLSDQRPSSVILSSLASGHPFLPDRKSQVRERGARGRRWLWSRCPSCGWPPSLSFPSSFLLFSFSHPSSAGGGAYRQRQR